MSARRAGFNPQAADLFADLDLQTCCPIERIANYPAAFAQSLAASPPNSSWLYTGALENHPALVDRMAAIRPLLGISGESLRAVRDPQRLAAELRAAGFAAPRCTTDSALVPTDGSWLSKPTASAGGIHIEPWHGGPTHHPDGPGRYFQERIAGSPASAVYVGIADSAVCLGVTRQLIGFPWCGVGNKPSDQFRYCGSIGPLELSTSLAERFAELGVALARSFRLIGLFGVDVILTAEAIWPLEVNPRCTASVEILEWATEIQAVKLHSEAFHPPSASSAFQILKRRVRRVCGKAVLFAETDFVVPSEFPVWAGQQNQPGEWPVVADIPSPDTAIRKSQPIATVLAAGEDESAVVANLRILAAEAHRRLAVLPASANNSGADLS